MALAATVNLDVVIIGGGAAGLWLLDRLRFERYRVLLLEARALGAGQTIASQGIIHGGLKYTLKGLWTDSAKTIREMPGLWRACLEGRRHPDLRNTRVRADFCHIWHTRSLRSRVGMFAAKSLLQVQPVLTKPDEKPAVLSAVQGEVYRLDEQVIDPESFLADLGGQHDRSILQCGSVEELEFSTDTKGQLQSIFLHHSAGSGQDLHLRALELRPSATVLLAGAGNAALRERLGLTGAVMQRRPLHMVMIRGRDSSSGFDLPVLNGHCVDGQKTRVTVTSAKDKENRTVWQVGGQIAEDGVAMSPVELVRHARSELAEALGGFAFDGVEWATYRVDRAEAATASGGRPDAPTLMREGNILTGWPTKLALVPMLVDEVMSQLDPPQEGAEWDSDLLRSWPRPAVALPPWETETTWLSNV